MDPLVALGLLPQEAAVYRALLGIGACTASGLAPRVDLTLEELSGVVQDLLDKDLVYRVVQTDVADTLLVCSDPSEVLERRVEEQARAVDAARQEVKRLQDRHQRTVANRRAESSVELLHGDDVAAAWVRVQRAATEVVRLVDRPPYVTPTAKLGVNPVEVERLARGVVYRVTYSQASFEVPGRLEAAQQGVAAGEQARYWATAPMKLLLADDRLGLFHLGMTHEAAGDALLIRPGPLLAGLIQFFDIMWAEAAPLHVATGSSPDATDDSILRLLATGATDDHVARQLGVSVRTIRRHIADLMSRHGALSRYQLGHLMAREHRPKGSSSGE